MVFDHAAWVMGSLQQLLQETYVTGQGRQSVLKAFIFTTILAIARAVNFQYYQMIKMHSAPSGRYFQCINLVFEGA